eukprot:6136877-Alexandrium_andersonii.AAC.1
MNPGGKGSRGVQGRQQLHLNQAAGCCGWAPLRLFNPWASSKQDGPSGMGFAGAAGTVAPQELRTCETSSFGIR